MNAPDLKSTPQVSTLLDSVPIDADAPALRERAERDGYLFFRALLPMQPLLELRHEVLGLCAARGLLVADAPLAEGRQRDGVRLGAFDDDFLYLQRELASSAAFAALRDDP